MEVTSDTLLQNGSEATGVMYLSGIDRSDVRSGMKHVKKLRKAAGRRSCLTDSPHHILHGSVDSAAGDQGL